MTATQPDSVTALREATSLDELWMPFTANRAFKRAPRLLASALMATFCSPRAIA